MEGWLDQGAETEEGGGGGEEERRDATRRELKDGAHLILNKNDLFRNKWCLGSMAPS